MNELTQYCDAQSAQGGYLNDADHRQARMFRNYLIASLLNVSSSDTVVISDANGIQYRIASFS